MATRFFHPARNPPLQGPKFPPQVLTGTTNAVLTAAGTGGMTAAGLGATATVWTATGVGAMAAAALTTARTVTFAGTGAMSAAGASIVRGAVLAAGRGDAVFGSSQAQFVAAGVGGMAAISSYTTTVQPILPPPPVVVTTTGTTADMAARIRAVLGAPEWFPSAAWDGTSQTPILDGLLAGLGVAWATIYSLLGYVRQQSRIATATGPFLNMVSQDFFGTEFQRLPSEGDVQYRSRIKLEIFRPRVTRPALIQTIIDLTGLAPTVFEPADTGDTGGWGNLGMTLGTGLAYGAAGGWGSLTHPFQAFVTVYRPHIGGIASAGGYYLGSGWAGGGYNVGALQYASLDMVQGQVTDAAIYAAIKAVQPAGSIIWTRVTN